jgi:ribonuclease-3
MNADYQREMALSNLNADINPAERSPSDTSNLRELEERLGHAFADRNILRLALTHPSVAVDVSSGNTGNNQRLEFLGDAVLQLVLSSELYARMPEVGEGVLTKVRAHLVNRHSLAVQARRLGLGEYLILSHGEVQSGGRQRPSTLADGFEALLGAIYMDAGFTSASAVISRIFSDALDQLSQASTLSNPKGELQEILQAQASTPPRYVVESVSGPDHDRVFECAVLHQGLELGRGKGKNKKEAESLAALTALQKLRENHPPAETPSP